MVRFMCIEIKADGSRRGLFTREFITAPIAGDFISMSDDGVGKHYEVVTKGLAVNAGGNLILSLIGDNDDLNLWLAAKKGTGFNG